MKKIGLVLFVVLICGLFAFAEDNALENENGYGSNDANNQNPIPTLYGDFNSGNNSTDDLQNINTESILNSANSNLEQAVSRSENYFDLIKEQRNKLMEERKNALERRGRDNNQMVVQNINSRINEINNDLNQREAMLAEFQNLLIQKINDSNMSAEKKAELIAKINEKTAENIKDLNEKATERISDLTDKLNKMSTISEIKDLRESFRDAFVNAAKDNNLAVKEEVMAARVAIARIISEAIKNNSEINFEDINGLGQEIRIEAGRIIADSNSIIMAKRAINAMIKEHVLQIRNDNNSVEIDDENLTTVVDGNISISDEGLKLNGRKIGVIPSEIKNRLENTQNKMQNLQLHIEKGIAKYETDVNNIRNLFGFIPIGTKERVQINAENGLVDSYERPWWSIIASGKDAATVGENVE